MDITKRTLTTTEESVLKNDLLDVQDWVTKAVDGKVNNCKKRMLREWLPKLYADDCGEGRLQRSCRKRSRVIKMGGEMFEERLKQLKAELQNLNMRIAEINFLINGYETAIKEAEEKKDEQTTD